MAQITNLKAAGLQTYYQTLMELSPGALLQANNVVINRDSVVESRRGIKIYGPLSNINYRARQLFEHKGRIFPHFQDKLAFDDGTGTFTEFSGIYQSFYSQYRIKTLEAKSNLYFTTNTGVKKISIKTPAELTSNGISDAGGAKAIAGSLTIVSSVSGFLPNNNKVSYRILWINKDGNDNTIFGAPSASMLASNTSSGLANVSISFQIPYNITATNYQQYKYRIYRSEISPSVPSDELNQVLEATPNLSQVTSGSVTIIDSLSDALRVAGVPLYTNQNGGEGILASNEPPPAALDIALFNGHMFYGNTRTRHSIIITLKSLNNSLVCNESFIKIKDQITGLSQTYIFSDVEDAGLIQKKFKAFNVAYDEYEQEYFVLLSIEQIVQSLVRVVNSNSSEIVTAYYLSVFGEEPGKFLLQRKTLVNNPFYLNTNSDAVSENFNPKLGVNDSTTLSSEVEEIANRLYFSKYQEHEAVPLLNYVDIGSKDFKILRIISLRESLFIFKEDGIFRLTGSGGTKPIWDISAFDNTAIIKAPDTAVTLGNQCYFYGNQGIMRLNESAIEPISESIQDKFIPFLATNTSLASSAFAVGYESDKALLVWTVSSKNDTSATVCYRYSTTTKTWTEWKITKTCAVLNRQNDRLYFGSGIDNYVEVERKEQNRFDFADREHVLSLSLGGVQGKTVKPTSFSFVEKEDVLIQEQYLTIFEFNTLLRQLDSDVGLNVHNFYNDLKMIAGDNLTVKIAKLVEKLNIADPTMSYEWSSPTLFQSVQTDYNGKIIDKLNLSSKTYFSNYPRSTGTKKYEAIILDVDKTYKEATLNIAPLFVLGPVTIYKGIRTEVEYAPQHAGDPASFKQFSTGTFMFERRSFYTAQVAYKSDISDAYEEISFTPNSSGIFGESIWGSDIVWGGQGDQGQIRTYIPLKKQRCRFLGCKFTHGVALESFQLYGISLSVRGYVISDRDYK